MIWRWEKSILLMEAVVNVADDFGAVKEENEKRVNMCWPEHFLEVCSFKFIYQQFMSAHNSLFGWRFYCESFAIHTLVLT